MEILSAIEVQLTSTERFANSRFEEMLDRGYSIHRAATRTAELFPGLDPAFYRWLRGETATLSPWHEETWSYVADNIRDICERDGFKVHVNAGAGTLTIVDETSGRALTLTPATNTQYGVKTGAAALQH